MIHSLDISDPVVFVYSQSCATITRKHLRTFSSPGEAVTPRLTQHPSCRQQLLFLWLCLVWTFRISWIIQYVVFVNWLFKYSIMFSRFVHVVAFTSSISFLFTVKIVCCMDISLSFICSLVDGHFGCFSYLAIRNNAGVNICIGFWVDIYLNSFEYIPRNGVSGLFYTSVFSVLSFQPVFQSGCTILYPHQKRKRVPFPPHPVSTCYYLSFWL